MTFVTNATGSITIRPITVTAASNVKSLRRHHQCVGRAHDQLGGSLAAGDTAAFSESYDTKNVGIGKTLTAAGSVNDGNSGNNYAVTFVTTTVDVDQPPGHHGHGGLQHQGLRRHNLGLGHADDHLRQPGRRRYGDLDRDL